MLKKSIAVAIILIMVVALLCSAAADGGKVNAAPPLNVFCKDIKEFNDFINHQEDYRSCCWILKPDNVMMMTGYYYWAIFDNDNYSFDEATVMEDNLEFVLKTIDGKKMLLYLKTTSLYADGLEEYINTSGVSKDKFIIETNDKGKECFIRTLGTLSFGGFADNLFLYYTYVGFYSLDPIDEIMYYFYEIINNIYFIKIPLGISNEEVENLLREKYLSLMNIDDVITILRCIVGLERITENYKQKYLFAGDELSIDDAIVVLRYLVGLSVN